MDLKVSQENQRLISANQQVKNTFMRESFWKKAKAFDELVTPAVKLLRIADDMEDEDGRALEPMGECHYKSFELQEHYKNLKSAEIPKVVMTACSRSFNDRWSLYHNEYQSVGWILNPVYRKHQQHTNKDVMQEFFRVLEITPGVDAAEATVELSKYRNYEGTTSLTLATDAESKLRPSDWWMSFGSDLPNLQKLCKLTMRQPISATRCEKNWSAYDHILTKKRSRLDPERASKLVLIYFNKEVIRKQFRLE